MVYPAYLIPHCHDGMISVIEQLEITCFARRANRPGPIVDTSGSRVLQDAILGSGESRQMKELSINLVGQHKAEDCYLKVAKSDNPYSDLWVLGTNGLCPEEHEVSSLSPDEYGIVYFKFARKDIPFPISEGENDCIATVCHKPTNCNYWHFQFEVTLTNGTLLPPNPKWKDRMLKRLLDILVDSWAYPSFPDRVDLSVPLSCRVAAQSCA